MTIELQIGNSWYPVKGRTYSRKDAIDTIRASVIPARVRDEAGKVIAARIIP